MILWKNISLLMLLLFNTHYMWAQQSVGIALYDVGRLYDTLPSLFYDDSFYTPSGRMQWDEKRYHHKIEQIARVIDSINMPIVVLYGVESLEVVRDIQRASNLDYSARHRSLDYYDGLDFALLYYGDMLHITDVGGVNYYSYIEGELLGRSVIFHLSRRGDKLYSVTSPKESEISDITIAWGRFDRGDLRRLGMQDPLREIERMGAGDTRGRDGWYLNYRLGVKLDNGVELSDKGVFINASLLTSDRSEPLATFSYDGYLGGYSRHLPQYIILDIEKLDSLD